MEIALLDLPDQVFNDLCTVLDASAEHNWRRLVEHLPDYTHMDVMELRNIAQQEGSASRELLMNLNGQGWTIVELAEAARRAGILGVIEILSAYCEEEGIEVDLTDNHCSNWLGARSCLHRSMYASELAPPTYNMDEACKRYRMPHPPADSVIGENLSNGSCKRKDPLHASDVSVASSSTLRTCVQDKDTAGSDVPVPQTPPPSYSSLEPPPTPAGLEEVKYEVLVEATEQFDRTPYKEGGHKVGEGGFGEVFQCSLVLRNGPVTAAVKVLLNQGNASGSATSAGSVDSVDRQQFSTETQSLSKLSHECLLPILAYSCNGPRLCLIYPFMSHGSLEAHLPNVTTLPPRGRLRVACDVASALHYLHTMPEGAIVHRDVKSANILLSVDWRGRLGDFGLARTLPSCSQHSSVLTTTVVGTLLYMAPEAIGGTVTKTADVYAFGVVLYELLTGRCALTKVATELGEDTDLLSYIEEYEGEQRELLIGEWEGQVQETLWKLAEQCILNRKRRPSSTKVLHELSSMCTE